MTTNRHSAGNLPGSGVRGSESRSGVCGSETCTGVCGGLADFLLRGVPDLELRGV